jgi:hypothetical protein
MLTSFFASAARQMIPVRECRHTWKTHYDRYNSRGFDDDRYTSTRLRNEIVGGQPSLGLGVYRKNDNKKHSEQLTQGCGGSGKRKWKTEPKLYGRHSGRSGNACSSSAQQLGNEARIAVMDDWLPFDEVVSAETISKRTASCRGPDFLHAYAKALRAKGERVQLVLRGGDKAKSMTLKVLHFGDSYVIAAFTAHHQT